MRSDMARPPPKSSSVRCATTASSAPPNWSATGTPCRCWRISTTCANHSPAFASSLQSDQDKTEAQAALRDAEIRLRAFAAGQASGAGKWPHHKKRPTGAGARAPGSPLKKA